MKSRATPRSATRNASLGGSVHHKSRPGSRVTAGGFPLGPWSRGASIGRLTALAGDLSLRVMSISVLVVEDHAELRTMIQHMLTQRGYDVRCASTVEEA